MGTLQIGLCVYGTDWENGRLCRLLAAVVNSIYSFWWDVTYDWGCDLLLPASQKPYAQASANGAQIPPRPLVLPHLHSRSMTLGSASSISSDEELKQQIFREHTRHAHDGPLDTSRRYPFGLRPVLLLPLAVYPFAIAVDLVLRLTWSAKLSSHLHSYSEGDLVIFWIELAELVRRWMWVFLRVEWEVVKQRSEARSGSAGSESDAMLMMGDRSARASRIVPDEEHEIDIDMNPHLHYYHSEGARAKHEDG